MDHAVAVVWVPLDLPGATIRFLGDVLDAREQERASGFFRERDRRRYVAAHGALRQVLAERLRILPRDVRIQVGPSGKPYLDTPYGVTSIQFNLAHSGDLAVIALAEGRSVGVDVEEIRPIPHLDDLARVVFSAQEHEAWLMLPVALRASALYAVWTRKEAYLKAKGDGLTIPMDSFDVTLSHDDRPSLRANRLDPTEVGRWGFHELAAPPGFAATLVVEGPVSAIDQRCWSPTEAMCDRPNPYGLNLARVAHPDVHPGVSG